MIAKVATTARSLKQALTKRLPKRRDDSGLTTLEWLLIVAAVAGLAALAVVLVQNVVRDTGEQIASNSARMQAAKFDAADTTELALAVTIDGTDMDTSKADVDAMNNKFGGRCQRMNLGYNAAFESASPPQKANWTDGVDVTPFGSVIGTGDTPPLCAIIPA